MSSAKKAPKLVYERTIKCRPCDRGCYSPKTNSSCHNCGNQVPIPLYIVEGPYTLQEIAEFDTQDSVKIVENLGNPTVSPSCSVASVVKLKLSDNSICSIVLVVHLKPDIQSTSEFALEDDSVTFLHRYMQIILHLLHGHIAIIDSSETRREIMVQLGSSESLGEATIPSWSDAWSREMRDRITKELGELYQIMSFEASQGLSRGSLNKKTFGPLRSFQIPACVVFGKTIPWLHNFQTIRLDKKPAYVGN